MWNCPEATHGHLIGGGGRLGSRSQTLGTYARTRCMVVSVSFSLMFKRHVLL